MTDKYETTINTVERHQRVFVDKFDTNEIWLSIQVANGNANCRLNITQAIQLVDALNRIIEESDIVENDDTRQYLADLEVKEMVERGEL